MFRDRKEAGQLLAERFSDLPLRNPLVLAIPRGGVVVGAELARCLHAELDVVLVRKIGTPRNPEFAIGSVGEDGSVFINRAEVEARSIDQPWLKRAVDDQWKQLLHRRQIIREVRAAAAIADRSIRAEERRVGKECRSRRSP